MQTLLVVFHLFLALGLVGLILIQHGKGADAGAAFGSGASSTVFGAQGSASFLTRTTAILATLFFVTSMTLAYLASQGREVAGVMDSVTASETAAPEQSEVPPAPVVSSEVPMVPVETATTSEVPAASIEAPAQPATEVPSAPVQE
jgi:preprotein translocase subunit SecG